MLENFSGDGKLVETLVRVSASLRGAALLDGYFSTLDAPGWAVELARTYLRVESGAALAHDEWALSLGFPAGRRYRVYVTNEGDRRSELVTAALAAFDYSGAEVVTSWQRCNELRAWLRAVSELRELGTRPRGRPLEAIITVGDLAEQIEDMRLLVGLSVRKWARRFGVAENTYRDRLGRGVVTSDWLAIARQIEQTAIGSTSRRRPPMPQLDMRRLITLVWASYSRRQAGLSAPAAMPTSAPKPEPSELDDVLTINLGEIAADDEAPLEE